MGKTRVGVRLKEAVGGKKSHNRSEDLVQLTEKYNVFCKRLKALIASLKLQWVASQVPSSLSSTVLTVQVVWDNKGVKKIENRMRPFVSRYLLKFMV